jgi:hypothetical protein
MDAGHDGGTSALTPIPFPVCPGCDSDAGVTTSSWIFYGPESGGPQDVWDSAFDEGGNLWVAGGAEGLFLMRADSKGNLSGTFEKFGLADGLHPYGWVDGETAKAMGVPDGSPADTHPSLDATPVISVAGGRAGTVFVGYEGKPGCEDAWHGDQWTPAAQWGDASVYKSGDADRVTLNGNGISVVHYDIFSGPGVVPNEVKGREKLCSIWRIVWNKARNEVWFGANHGFAVANASAGNAPNCGGEPGCSPVWEHSHPAISGCAVDYDFFGGQSCPSDQTQWLTDAYFGVAVDPSDLDMWMGGANRTTKFHSATKGDYFSAQADTEAAPGPAGAADRWDLWSDAVPEWDPTHGVIYVPPFLRVDDSVSGIAALPDGTAFVGSFANGLIRIDSFGSRQGDFTGSLNNRFVASVATDPLDHSIWVGMAYGPGITRLNSSRGTVEYFGDVFGPVGVTAFIGNIQAANTPGGRKVAVSITLRGYQHLAKTKYAGAVGVYFGK